MIIKSLQLSCRVVTAFATPRLRDTAETVTFQSSINQPVRETVNKRLTVSIAPQYFTWGAIYLFWAVRLELLI